MTIVSAVLFACCMPGIPGEIEDFLCRRILFGNDVSQSVPTCVLMLVIAEGVPLKRIDAA